MYVTLVVASLLAADGGLTAAMDRHLRGEEQRGTFSGSVLVARGETVLFSAGYGFADVSRRKRATAETRYYVASISKQFTAAAILKLAEAGKLRLDDPITRFLGVEVPADKRAVTIHHLLSHQSGLGQRYAADGLEDRGAAVRAVLAAKLEFEPGKGFSYSNDGYSVLAAIVELASGKPFETYVREQLLEPAGLGRTGFWGSADGADLAAMSKVLPAAVRRPNWGFRGATGMSSTVGDLHRWQQALFGARVLTRPSVERLLRAHVGRSGGVEVGYGWFRSRTAKGRPVVWTRGSEDLGHNAVLKVYPDGLVLVVASCSGEGPDKMAASRRVGEELERLIEASVQE